MADKKNNEKPFHEKGVLDWKGEDWARALIPGYDTKVKLEKNGIVSTAPTGWLAGHIETGIATANERLGELGKQTNDLKVLECEAIDAAKLGAMSPITRADTVAECKAVKDVVSRRGK